MLHGLCRENTKPTASLATTAFLSTGKSLLTPTKSQRLRSTGLLCVLINSLLTQREEAGSDLPISSDTHNTVAEIKRYGNERGQNPSACHGGSRYCIYMYWTAEPSGLLAQSFITNKAGSVSNTILNTSVVLLSDNQDTSSRPAEEHSHVLASHFFYRLSSLSLSSACSFLLPSISTSMTLSIS